MVVVTAVNTDIMIVYR